MARSKEEGTTSAREAFDTWRKEYPDATETEARTVWAIYNAEAEDPEAGFPTNVKFAEPEEKPAE